MSLQKLAMLSCLFAFSDRFKEERIYHAGLYLRNVSSAFPIQLFFWKMLATTTSLLLLLLVSSPNAGAQVTNMPSSTATGIALGAAASFRVSQDNQWKDYEDVVVIATLNGVAKLAANTGHSMITADYNLIASQVRNWLDAKNPQRPLLSGDQVLWLRYAIDSVAPLASSAQAGQLLPAALGGLEKLKFSQLEIALDPTRQYPADLGLSSVKMNGYLFVADRVQEASDLAQNDPQYGAAVNDVLKDLTGMDATNTYSDIQNLYPYAVPTLPTPNSDGSFTILPQNVMSQYRSIVAFVQCATDNDLSGLENPQNIPANCSVLPTAQERIGQDGQLVSRDTAAADATWPGTACSKKSPDNPNGICWNDAQSAITGLSKLEGLSDPNVSTEILTVGTAVVQAGTAISALAAGGAALGVLGVLGPVGAIAAAGVAIYSVFASSGSSNANANAAILAQIQKLSQQIARFQQDVTNRFNQVDAALKTILNTLNQDFALINYQLGVLNGNVHAIQAGLLDVQAQLNQLEQYTLAYSQAVSKGTLISQMNGCLNYAAIHSGADIGSSMYGVCENDFYSWTHDNAVDQLWAGLQQPDYSDGNIYSTFLLPLSVNVNYLAQFPAQNLGLTALSGLRLPNPNEWTLGARAYLELAHEWPQYATQINSSRIDDLIQIGTAYRQAVQNANSINSGSTISGNQPLFAAVTSKYSAAAAGIQNAVASRVNTFVIDPSRHLQGLQVGLWGGSQQSTSYVPAALSGSMHGCNGDSSGYAVPANLASLVSSLPRVAEQLGVGNLTLCLDYSTTNAFTVNLIPFAIDTLDTYRIVGVINGNVVFSQTVHTLSMPWNDSGCGINQIWNTLTPPCDASLSSGLFHGQFLLVTRVPLGMVGNSINSQCWTLASVYNAQNSEPPSAPFQQLIDAGYYACRPAPFIAFPNLNINSLQSVFVSYADPVDITAGLNSVEPSINNALRALQQSLYGQIGADFSATTSVEAAGQSLTASKLLAQAYANFGLPNSIQTDDTLHSLLYGNQGILDASGVQSDFLGFSTASIADTTGNKVTDEISAINTRLTALSTAITDALNHVEQTQVPESLSQVDLTLEDLQSFEALKNAGALSPCSFQLPNSFVIASTSGGPTSVGVQVVPGCTWRATTGASWLGLTSGQSGSGPGTVGLSISPNANGTTRAGIVIIGDQIFKVFQTASSGPPTVISVMPGNGAGSSRTFAFSFSDPNGTTDIDSAQVDINATLAVPNACYFFYVRGPNSIYLASDAGAWRGPITIGGSGTLQNSQCSVSGAGSSVSLSGNNLTLNLAVTFKAAFTGAKNVYAEVKSASHDSGWSPLGAWTVESGAPTPDFSLNMSTGPGTLTTGGSATYTVTLTSSNGFNDSVGLAVSSLPAGVTGSFDSSALVGSGSATLTITTTGGASLGSFTITVTGTSGSLIHNTSASLTLTGASGGGPPVPTSVTPNTGSGTGNTFAFAFSDTNGAADIVSAQIDINATLSVAGACYLYYPRSANAIYLASDTGVWQGPLTIGSAGVLRNSQCVVNGAPSSVSTLGNTLTLNLALSFMPGFAGAKNVYMESRNASQDSGWSVKGTWTVGTAPTPDFAIDMSAGPGTVTEGSSPTYTVTLTGSNGFSGIVSLGVSGLPAGVAGSFEPTTIMGSGSTTLTLTTTGAASSSFTITVTGTSGALQHSATASLTVTGGSGGPPVPTSVTPNTGAGLSQTFVFTFTAPNGTMDIVSAQMDINATLAVPNACYFLYARAANTVYLASDAGVWQGPLTVGTAGKLANGQCSVDGASSSVSSTENTLALNLALTFKAEFAGAKNVYMEVQNASHDSGWTQAGTWTVGSAGQIALPPTPVSVTPNSGSGLSQIFAFAFSDPNGATDIRSVQMDINATLAVPNACYLFYVRSLNEVYLASDTGVWQGPLAVGDAGTLTNSQCSLDAQASSTTSVGNTLTVNLALTFNAEFTGAKNIYMEVRDATHDSGWLMLGGWTP